MLSELIQLGLAWSFHGPGTELVAALLAVSAIFVIVVLLLPSTTTAMYGDRGAGGPTGRSLTAARRAQPFLVSAKIAAISSILASSSSAVAASMLPFVPDAPASLVASLTRVCSWGTSRSAGA